MIKKIFFMRVAALAMVASIMSCIATYADTLDSINLNEIDEKYAEGSRTDETEQTKLSDEYQYISRSSHVFTDCDYSSEIVGTIWQNSKVKVIGINDGWAKIEYKVIPDEIPEEITSLDEINEADYKIITGYVREDDLADSFIEYEALTPGGTNWILAEDDLKMLLPASRIYDVVNEEACIDLNKFMSILDMNEWYVVDTQCDDIKLYSEYLYQLKTSEEYASDPYVTIYYRPDGARNLIAMRVHGSENFDSAKVHDLSFDFNKGRLKFKSNEPISYKIDLGFFVDTKEECTIFVGSSKQTIKPDEHGIVWVSTDSLSKVIKIADYKAEGAEGITIEKDMVNYKIVALMVIAMIVLTIHIVRELLPPKRR